jgi:hypothetical protein
MLEADGLVIEGRLLGLSASAERHGNPFGEPRRIGLVRELFPA